MYSTSGEYLHQPPSHIHDGRPTSGEYQHQPPSHLHDGRPTQCILPAASTNTSLLATYTMDALLSVFYQRRVPTPASQPLTRWTPYSVYSTSGEYLHQPPSHLHDGRPTSGEYQHQPPSHLHDGRPTQCILPAASTNTSLLATYTMDALLSVLYQRRVPTPASQPLTRWTPYSVYSTSGEYQHQPPSHLHDGRPTQCILPAASTNTSLLATYTMDALFSVFYQRRVPTPAS